MKKNGFTLVELLAVIVILAIIMIIAIPAVLETMQSARKKTFTEYATKVSNKGQEKYLADQLTINPGTCALYDIQKDLGYSNTGDYKGYVVVKNLNDNVKVYVTLNDNNYMVYAADNSKLDKLDLSNYNSSSTYLSKENVLTVADCATYSEYIPTTSTYETKTITPVSDAQSSTRKLLTGEKEGQEGWVGVYVNGVITECYNKNGDIGPDLEPMNNGTKANYCTGQTYSTDLNKCSTAKSTICCTAEHDTTNPSKMYLYTYNENQSNSSYPHKSCGWRRINGIGWAQEFIPGGGLPESGVYND